MGVLWRALGGAAHPGRPAPQQVCLQLLNALATVAAGPGPGGVSGAGDRGGAGGRAQPLPKAPRFSGPPPPLRALQRQRQSRARPPPHWCVSASVRVSVEGSSRERGRRGLAAERPAKGTGARAARADRQTAGLGPDARCTRAPCGRRVPPKQRRGGRRRGWRCLRAHARSQTLGPRHRHTTRRARRAPRTPAPALTLTLTRRPRSSRCWRRRSARIPAGAGGK